LISLKKGDKAMNLDELELSVRAYNCLMRAGITTVEELCNKTTEDMMRVRNLGSRCLGELIGILKANGLKFREPEEEPVSIKGVITANITDSALEFESKAEGMALSKWGYNKADIEKCLLELDRYRGTGLTPEEIRDHEEMFKAYRHVCGGKAPEEIETLLNAEEQGLLIRLNAPLDIIISCAMCTNIMKSDRGCDGGCRYDEALLKKIMQAISDATTKGANP
jgi:hypothetical protein